MPARKVIGFPRGAGAKLERYVAATGVDGVSVDWSVPLDYARERLQPRVAVQGNLDPMVLMAGGEALERRCGEYAQGWATGGSSSTSGTASCRRRRSSTWSGWSNWCGRHDEGAGSC